MFQKVSEAKISKAIVGEFMRWFDDYIISDVVVVDGGPWGFNGRYLSCGKKKRSWFGKNNYIGLGVFWSGNNCHRTF
jgi:ribulose 1,5-bisphosphate synthetase/thiazole synthase